jgi:hypothetical protein
LAICETENITTAEFAVLGHTPGEGDRPLRPREQSFSQGQSTGVIGQSQTVNIAAQMTRKRSSELGSPSLGKCVHIASKVHCTEK